MKIELRVYNPPRFGLNHKLLLIYIIVFIWAIIIFKMNKMEQFGLLIPLLLYAIFIDKYRFDPKKYLGVNMIITNDFIQIGEERFPMNELKDLKIDINDYHGMVKEKVYETSTYLNGINNTIQFKFIDKVYTLKFYISDSKRFNSFKELYHDWYTRKIPFKESSNNGSRTYCME